MPETDKQIGVILESIQNVTPEMIKQAMAYYHFIDIAWLVILGVIALTALIFVVIESSHQATFPYAWGLVFCIALLICAPIASDLIKLHMSPDYYATECMVNLVRQIKN